MWSEPRLVIERLCAERGEDFAGLSRMLGRNPAYIQQYVRRGVPIFFEAGAYQSAAKTWLGPALTLMGIMGATTVIIYLT